MSEAFHLEPSTSGTYTSSLQGVSHDRVAPTHQSEVGEGFTSESAYTADDVKKVVFESFRHSQGAPLLQEQILTFVGGRYAAGLSGLEDIFDDVQDQLVTETTRYVSRGMAHRRIDQEYIDESKKRPKPIKQDTPKEFINKQVLDSLFMLLDGANHSTWAPFDAVQALDYVIQQDFKYLGPTRENARPRPGAAKDPHAQGQAVENSPHASQFVLYGLIGRPTRAPEISEFFREATASLPNLLDSSHPEYEQREQKLRTVAQAHLQHYPADTSRIQPQYGQLLVQHWGEAKAQEIGLIA